MLSDHPRCPYCGGLWHGIDPCDTGPVFTDDWPRHWTEKETEFWGKGNSDENSLDLDKEEN